MSNSSLCGDRHQSNNVARIWLLGGSAGSHLFLDCYRAATKPFCSTGILIFCRQNGYFAALRLSNGCPTGDIRIQAPRKVITIGSAFAKPKIDGTSRKSMEPDEEIARHYLST